MPATPDPVQFGEIADFTPGIHSENTSVLPPGAAHPDGTFGCFSSVDGFLQPLPRVTASITPPADVVAASSGNLIEEVRITGLAAVGPIFLGASGTQGADENHTGVVIGVEYWTDAVTTTATHHTELWMYHRDFVTPTWDNLSTLAPTGITFSPIAIITVDILPTRSNNTDPSLAGPVVLAVCEFGPIYMFPDDTAPSVQATRWLPGDHANDPTMVAVPDDFIPVMICVHQGRLITVMRAVTAFGDNSFYDTDEQFFWSNVNDIRTPQATFAAGGTNYFRIHVGWEHPTGYGVFESLTADELLTIKKSGGAWVLRGDLDNFQAVNYPFVRSTGESFNRGARSSKGFVYPVDGGTVWNWTGGQTSTEIASQLDTNFWRVPTIPASGDDPVELDIFSYYTACSTLDVFTYFPNNWVWDCTVGDLGAWWRIDDPADFIIHRWTTDWRGIALYGTVSGFTTDDDIAIREYDSTVAARSTYTWLSHPVLPDQGEIDIRAVTIAGSGIGTVTVTCFSAEDSTGTTLTFPMAGTPNYPTVVRAPSSIKGTNIQFQVTSTATDDADPAPNVHRLRYDFVPSNQLPSA